MSFSGATQQIRQEMGNLGTVRSSNSDQRDRRGVSHSYRSDADQRRTPVPTPRIRFEIPHVSVEETRDGRLRERQQSRERSDGREREDEEYQEMCADLMALVQDTVQGFLRSRSPRPRHDQPGYDQGMASPRPGGVPISKWKIEKFDGREEGLARFLTRVNQFALAERASKSDLFRNRIHLFSGHAADFVALSMHIRDWDELVDEITKFSMGSTSDCDLLRKIQDRRQGLSESCAVYVTQMEMLFRSLRQTPPEEDRCDIIIRGLRPSIRAALAGNSQLRTLHDLRLAAQRVEKLTQSQRLEETAAMEARGRRRTVSPRSNANGSQGNRGRHSSSGTKDFCFNCGDKTHHRKECKKEKQILCYECGKVGVYASQCCWQQGNAKGRV